MKNLILCAIWLFLSLLSISCGGSQARGEQSVVDSLLNDSLMRDSIKLSFSSPDIRLYELNGHVNSCSVNTYDAVMEGGSLQKKGKSIGSQELTFTEQGWIERDVNRYGKHTYHYDEQGRFKKGECLNMSGSAMKFTIKRDKENRICHFNERAADGYDSDMQYTIEYSYNKAGLMKKADYGFWEMGLFYEYSYNNEGLVINKKEVLSDYEGQRTTTYEYTYTEFDQCHNWIVREAKSMEKLEITSDVEGAVATVIQKELSPTIQTRKIVYY